jgi:hypothetical protein
MASIHKHIRSSTADKRPTTAIADGQLAMNTNNASPGLFFKDSAGSTIIKVGPVHVGSTAPNASPAVGGSTGNSTGEIWLDTSITPNGVKIYSASASGWINATPIGSTTIQGLLELATNAETQAGTDGNRAVTPAGLQSKVSDSVSTTSASGIASSTAVKTAYDLANAALPKSGGTVTGALIIGSGASFVFEGATDDTFETTLAVTDPTADRTITLPDVSGTVVTTGDTGTVTSTMIANGTIVDADVNASAAIAHSKLANITAGSVLLGNASGVPTATALSGDVTINSSGVTAISSGVIVDADVSASAEIAVSKLADGSARQLLQTDAAGTGVEWTSNVDIPGTLDVTGAATFDGNATIAGDLTVDTNTLYIDSTNNRVGIGTTSPDYTLDVNGPIRSDGTSGGLYFGGNSTTPAVGAAIHRPAADTLAFVTASAERARIDSSGRLLVGTSSNASNAIAVVQGIAGDATTTGVLAVRYGSTRPTSADVGIGAIRFESTSNTSSNYHYAQISCATDGASSSDTDLPGRLVFSTTADGASSPTERMRIKNNGQHYFYTGSNVQVNTAGTSSASGAFVVTNGATGIDTGTTKFAVMQDGDCENTNNSYGALSDAKLKENVVDATSQWDDIKTLQVRKYNFKEETGHSTHTQIGLIAQEVELVSPGLVGESPDFDKDGNDLGTVTKSVNYSVLYMKAVKALQEAMERIEQLETEMAEVKAQLQAQ